jgi:hypothetical protein
LAGVSSARCSHRSSMAGASGDVSSLMASDSTVRATAAYL